MSELSLFLDESGERQPSRHLLHPRPRRARAVQRPCREYRVLSGVATREGPARHPFHATPLLNGHNAYEGMDVATRKKLFSAFRVFFRHLPVHYGLVVLRTREYTTLDDVAATMRRRIVDFLFDNLTF